MQPKDSFSIILGPAIAARYPVMLRKQLVDSYVVRSIDHWKDFSSHTPNDCSVYVLDCTKLTRQTHKVIQKILDSTRYSQILLIGLSQKPTLQIPDEAQRCTYFYDTPVDGEPFAIAIAKACIVGELLRSNEELREVVQNSLIPRAYTSCSHMMQSFNDRIIKIAQVDSTVLLCGETGTGKTTFARLIHDKSPRRSKPFVSISCVALPRDLLEAELFGYEKGAFTGAVASRPGCIELAEGGTLFLDEIGDLPHDLQPKLLTYLQERWIRRLGGTVVHHPNVRIIAATNRNLETMSKRGEFREDLLFRLNVLTEIVPPLRERPEDIVLIANAYLAQLAQRRGLKELTLSKNATQKLLEHPWPGNVRQLQNVLERASVFATNDLIEAEDLILNTEDLTQVAKSIIPGISLAGRTLEAIERQALEDTLREAGGDKNIAAHMLGVSLKTIYNKLRHHKLR